MNHPEGLAALRAVAGDRRDGQGSRLKRALLVLAIPATAALATACYGAPMYASGAQGDQTEETVCQDGIDNDGDGLADPDCSSGKGCDQE